MMATHAPAHKPSGGKAAGQVVNPIYKFKVGDQVQCSRQESARASAKKNGTKYPHWTGLVVTELPSYLGGPYTCEDRDGRRGCFFETTLSLREPKKARDYQADHMRRTLRKYAGFSEEEAAQFVANTPKEKRKQYSRKLPGRQFMGLKCSFSWEDSPQGFKYWAAINARVHPFLSKNKYEGVAGELPGR